MVACVAATVGLLSCSGGSDDNSYSEPLSVQRFKSGSRAIIFNAATQLRVYSSGTPVQGSGNGEDVCTVTGYFGNQSSEMHVVEARYEVKRNDEGAIVSATVELTFTSSGALEDLNEDTALISDLGLQTPNADGDGGQQLTQNAITFNIDYTAWTASCTLAVAAGANGDDAAGGDNNNQQITNNFRVYIGPV